MRHPWRLAACRLALPGLVVMLTATGAARADDAVDALRARVYALAVAGEDEQAIPLARELVSATERAYGPDHPETAVSLDALGDRLQKTLQFDEAERVYRRGLEIRERELGPDDAQVVASLVALGSTLGRQKRHADTEREWRAAIGMARKSAALHQSLGVVLFEAGRRSSAGVVALTRFRCREGRRVPPRRSRRRCGACRGRQPRRSA